MRKSRATSRPSHRHLPRLPGARPGRRPKFSKTWLEAVKLSPFALQASCDLTPTGCVTLQTNGALTGQTPEPNRREWENTSIKSVSYGTSPHVKSYKLYGSLYLKDVTDYAGYADDGCPGAVSTAQIRYRKMVNVEVRIGAYLSEFGNGPQMPAPTLRYLETWAHETQGISVWGTGTNPPVAQLDSGTINIQITRELVDHDNNSNTPEVRRMMACVDGATPLGPDAFVVESPSSITTKTHPFKLRIEYWVKRDSPENRLRIEFRVGVKFDGQADWTYSDPRYLTVQIQMAH